MDIRALGECSGFYATRKLKFGRMLFACGLILAETFWGMHLTLSATASSTSLPRLRAGGLPDIPERAPAGQALLSLPAPKTGIVGRGDVLPAGRGRPHGAEDILIAACVLEH